MAKYKMFFSSAKAERELGYRARPAIARLWPTPIAGFAMRAISMTATDIVAALGLAAWIYLLLLHGGFWLAREREDMARDRAREPKDWPRVTAVIPARNEADMLPRSLASLLAQDYPGEFSIVLVDDQSSDGTADIAARHRREFGPGNLRRRGRAAARRLDRQGLGACIRE